MSFLSHSNRNQMASINMTPLIDIMLVLLIIFMVTAPMLTTGIDISLPESRTGSNLQSKAMVVVLDSSGRIKFEDQFILQYAFEARLRQLAQENQKQPIIIQADRDINYGHVISLVDVIREAGFTQVGFVAQAISQPIQETIE